MPAVTRDNIQSLYAAGVRDFREANLEGANLRWVNLREAILRGVNLEKTNLQDALLDS